MTGCLVDSVLLSAAAAGVGSLLAFPQWPVLEANDQFTVVEFDSFRALAIRQQETALLVVRFLDVVLFAVGLRYLEPHTPPPFAGAHGEDIGGVILGGLDVVLILIGPVQLYFLAVIGDEIGRAASARVAALRDEVALGVIAGEEIGEVVVDVGFRGCVGPGLAPFQLQLPDHWSCFGIDTQASGLSAGFGQFLFQFRLLAGGILRQRRLHLRQADRLRRMPQSRPASGS